MKKFVLLNFLIILVFSYLKAQDTSILWEISGNGITKPSHLFGSLKFIGEKEYYLPKEATENILRSDLFAIEDQVDHHAQHELNKVLHFPKGESLATGAAIAIDALTGAPAPINPAQTNGQPNILSVFGTGLGPDVTDQDGTVTVTATLGGRAAVPWTRGGATADLVCGEPRRQRLWLEWDGRCFICVGIRHPLLFPAGALPCWH